MVFKFSRRSLQLCKSSLQTSNLFYKNKLNINAGNTSKNYCKDIALSSGGTMQKFKEDVRLIMGVEKGYKPLSANREHLNAYLPKKAEDLPTRSIKDSYLYGIIPLSNDEALQDKYISNLGSIRFGRLMEDLDIFAVMVLLKYLSNPKLPPGQPTPYTIVTITVDSIRISDYAVKVTEDVKISGNVIYVGKSSAQIAVNLDQNTNGVWHRITQAHFLMAARDATNNFSAIINPLVPTNDEEAKVIIDANENVLKLSRDRKTSLTKSVPTESEQNILHDMFMKSSGAYVSSSRSLPKGCVWMKDTIVSNSVFSFPEDRNLHNTVFGGFLMRQAIELSYAATFIFTKHRAALKGVSEMTFNKPIAVGSIIQMHAHVVYTRMQYVQITVYANAIHHILGMEDSTNVFHVTYEVPELVYKIIPHTYQEAMMYIDGLRHFNQIIESKS